MPSRSRPPFWGHAENEAGAPDTPPRRVCRGGGWRDWGAQTARSWRRGWFAVERKGLRPQRPLPLPDLLPGRHVERSWGRGGGPAIERRGSGKGRSGWGSAGRCGVTMTTGPEAAREVTGTRLARSHVSGDRRDMKPRREPRPDLGWPTCWFAGLPTGRDHRPQPPTPLRPVFRMSTPVPECSGRRAVVVKRGDLGWHWGAVPRKSGKWENGRLDGRKGERQTRKRRACLAEKQEEREAQGEAVLRRMGLKTDLGGKGHGKRS